MILNKSKEIEPVIYIRKVKMFNLEINWLNKIKKMIQLSIFNHYGTAFFKYLSQIPFEVSRYIL